MRAVLIILLSCSCTLSNAQSFWRLDSLAAQWPVRAAMEEARRKGSPGVIRAMDTRDLYAKLRDALPGMPVFADDSVSRYVDELGEPRREELRALLGMSEAYRLMIEGELVRQGLPRELKYLPMALSAMSTWTGTREGGAGLWSLTYPVAVRYGLKVGPDIDERRDPRLSTMAAVSWLKDLHARYGDWPLTIAAFACGPANVTRAQGRTLGSTDLRVLYPHFSDDARPVLPLWMAMAYLAKHAEALGIRPIAVTPFEAADTIRVSRELRVEAVAATLGIEKARLRALNPTLCSGRIPAFHQLLLPRGERARYEALSDSVQRMQQWLAETERNLSQPGEDVVARTDDGREAIYYRVRSGDYLGRIAQKFGVKVSQLKTWNKLSSDMIDVGEELVIYVSPTQRSKYERTQTDEDEGPTNQVAPPPPPAKRTSTAGHTWYTVRAGDSLYTIAKRYPGIDAARLMRVNGISADIHPGQRLKIPIGP